MGKDGAGERDPSAALGAWFRLTCHWIKAEVERVNIMPEGVFVIIWFVFLALVGAGVYAVFAWRNMERRDDPDPGIGTPRRVYFYFAAFVGLMMTASGATIIISTVLDSLFGANGADDYTTSLASGLSLAVVGIPAWLFHWRFVQRAAERTAADRRSVFRNLYIYTALGVSLSLIGFSAFLAIEYALGASAAMDLSLGEDGGGFSGFPWAALVVWGAVWGFHWRTASAESAGMSAETLAIRRMYLYLASAAFAAMLAMGAFSLARVGIGEGYQAAFGAPPGRDAYFSPGDEARTALAAALVGCAAWAAHWLMFAAGDRRSVLRWAHILIAALGGGAALALAGAAYALYAVLRWAVGVADVSTAQHFASPTAIAPAMTAVAAAIWLYHRKRMWAEAGDSPRGIARIYALALAAIGLFFIALSVAGIADTALTALGESLGARGGGSDFREGAAYILATLAVGFPVWWFAWRRARAFASEDPQTERAAPARKVYTLGILCLGMLALTGGSSAALFVILRDLLGANVSANTLIDLALPMSYGLPAAVILPYHWIVYRQDRAFYPEDADTEDAAPTARKEVILAASPDLADDLAAALEANLGYPVRTLNAADSQTFGDAPDADALANAARAIAESDSRRALVIAERGGLRVIWRD